MVDWTPPNLLQRLGDAFAGRPDPNAGRGRGDVLKSSEGRDGRTWVRCPNCRRRVLPIVLVDLRAINAFGEDWACDGCWTGWQREGRIVGGEPLTLERWVTLHDAPASVRDKMRAIDDRRRPR